MGKEKKHDKNKGSNPPEAIKNAISGSVIENEKRLELEFSGVRLSAILTLPPGKAAPKWGLVLVPGSFFNDIVEMDRDHTDPLTLNQNICCRVKIYPAT